MSVKVVREWGNSLGKKWISCLLSINIPTTATNHKIAEGPIKQSGSEASMWAVRVEQLFSVIKRPLQRGIEVRVNNKAICWKIISEIRNHDFSKSNGVGEKLE